LPGTALVLVAPAIDAGWIPLLRQVDAVVVETGGELSHGSILVREVGLPAVTNVHGARTVLRDGMMVEVDAAAGWVRATG
jgi:pyruvate,water dikinase